mmetsp:Transcript_20447/g.56729  ORF Transcript_20447/g.56729 Transcript_20447/m.56729 type:complete len:148 (-) Transcript_20447:213-656(-)
MLSVALQKDPNRKTKYWDEVCCREDRPHLFHPKNNFKEADRSTPLSTSRASHHGFAHGGQGFIQEVNIAAHPPALEVGAGRYTRALGAAARCSLTPRGDRLTLTEKPRAFQPGCLVQLPVHGDNFQRGGRPGLPDPRERPPASCSFY